LKPPAGDTGGEAVKVLVLLLAGGTWLATTFVVYRIASFRVDSRRQEFFGTPPSSLVALLSPATYTEQGQKLLPVLWALMCLLIIAWLVAVAVLL
jgi:hypothetical protein